MSGKTRNLTLSALFSALAAVTLYLSSISPTGQLGIAALASVFSAAAIIECGPGSGISVYIISSVLSALLVPIKGAILVYILFFGYYPIIKYLIEKLRNTVFIWVLKLAVFNAVLAGMWFFLRPLIFDFTGRQINIILLFLGGSAIFILFDYGYSRLICFYISQISERIKRKR